MSPKRKVTVNEFAQYTPASRNELRTELDESVNAFTFDKEFEPSFSESDDSLSMIETIKASRIYPDTLQPRPSPLPQAIRMRFRMGELDAFQAAREWLKLAEKDPFTMYDVARYLSMGENMAANGQINPITGRWEQAQINGKEIRIFRIETGEQRFWSAVIHHIQKKLSPDDLMLRVSVVPTVAAPTEIATVKRQISENRKNMQLTEVLQAREIARLLLAQISEKNGETFITDSDDEYDYFRKVLHIGRVPHGVWDTIQVEFNLSQHRMRQSLEILNFPSHLLDLAHKARLSYRTLSQILKLPEEAWETAILDAARQNLEMEEDDIALDDVPDETNGRETTNKNESAEGALRLARRSRKSIDSAELAYRGLRRFYRSVNKGIYSNPELLGAVADDVTMDGYSEELITFMEDLITALRVRLHEKDQRKT